MKDVIPPNVDHIHGKIGEIDPQNNAVHLENGEKVSFHCL